MDQPFETACLDAGCTMTIIDRVFLKANRPDCEIHRIDVLLPLRGIGS